MVKDKIGTIINELTQAYSLFNNNNESELIKQITEARHIICHGAGRMGYAAKAFSKRLNHLNFKAFYYEDSNLPNLNSQDLLIIGSSSGNTETMTNIANIAKEKIKMKLITITSNESSKLAKISDLVIKLNVPNKEMPNNMTSMQPMTSLSEQFIFIVYDAIILELISHLKIDTKNFWSMHSNLE